MTREEANEVLHIIASDIISPLAFDERPASKVWEQELTSTIFTNVVGKINAMIK